jgi:ketosteroid isomerase-like protein
MGLYDLLTSLQLLATDTGRQAAADNTKWDADTPASMQVIKSGALSITKRWTKIVSRVGGGVSGVLAVFAGYVATVQKDLGDPVTVALIGAAALLASATALAIALFVKGDLEARGQATAARHAARGEIVAAFLRATAALEAEKATSDAADRGAELLQALASFPGRMSVRTRAQPQLRLVTGLQKLADGGWEIYVVDDWVPLDQVTDFSTGAFPP